MPQPELHPPYVLVSTAKVMHPRIPVTVIVPVKNEEKNLAKCLALLDRFEEVVVVDSSSTDLTQAIARQFGAKLLNFVWDGGYPKKRNWFLLNHKPACDWVLFIDADEFVTDEFCLAVGSAITSNAYVGYWLNYSNWFLGQRLRHGVRQQKLAMFQYGKGLYERIDEGAWSRLDMEIHEHPILNGAVGEIIAPIEHNDDRGIIKFIDRHRDYALWEARRILILQRAGVSAQGVLTRRQRFKYRNLEKWWYPWFYFLYTYIVKLGVLDGKPGFNYAIFKAWYFQSIRLLIREHVKFSGKI